MSLNQSTALPLRGVNLRCRFTARAGLVKGDVVTAVDGIVIKSAAQLRNAIGLTPVGQEVELTYERKGSRAMTRVRIEPGERTAAGRMGRP